MRRLILGAAIVCYAAALAIAGASMRLPVPQPTRPVASLLVAAPAAAPEPPTAGTTGTAPTPAPPPAAPSPLPAGQFQETIEGLAREQAASRELVAELRTTVSRLQQELARQGAAQSVSEPHGRTVIVLGGDLIPPGQETLTPAVVDAVVAVIPDLIANPRQIVSVEGHTDSRPIRTPAGKPFKDNADLSRLRARAVADLLREHGVPAQRIRVKGWGDVRPLATNDTAEGRDRNRRVEILLLPPSPER